MVMVIFQSIFYLKIHQNIFLFYFLKFIFNISTSNNLKIKIKNNLKQKIKIKYFLKKHDLNAKTNIPN
jgi:hypothetical protein